MSNFLAGALVIPSLRIFFKSHTLPATSWAEVNPPFDEYKTVVGTTRRIVRLPHHVQRGYTEEGFIAAESMFRLQLTEDGKLESLYHEHPSWSTVFVAAELANVDRTNPTGDWAYAAGGGPGGSWFGGRY